MEQINLKVFAERLKKLRGSLSTRMLGEAVGTSNATISRYETGKRSPDLSLVYRIAKYFNVSIEYLCGEDIDTDKELLIEIFSKLSEETKKQAIDYVTYLYKKKK